MPTFLETARDHLAIQRVAAQTRKHNEWLLEHLKPIHPVDVAEVDAPKLLMALRAIEAQGANNTAHRACNLAGAVLGYALAAGTRTAANPAAGLKTILVAQQKRNRAAIVDPKRFGSLLRAIDTLPAGAVRDALTIAPHVFVRPSELRGMTWNEIDWGGACWNIPKERMKMRRPFTKWLSKQSMEILRAIWIRDAITEGSRAFVFPGRKSGSISENIMGMALERLWFLPAEHTPHGFRASASTMLHEAGHDHVIIEAALAHRTDDPLGSAYNRAEYARQQVDLHVAWSGMVDSMRGAV